MIHTEVLPTAVVTNAADHYVVIDTAGDVQFVSVNGLARGLEIPPWTSLWGVLTAERPSVPTVNQPSRHVPRVCLGRGVHGGVAGREAHQHAREPRDIERARQVCVNVLGH